MSPYVASSKVARSFAAAAAVMAISGAALGSNIGSLEMKFAGTGLGQNVSINVDGVVTKVFAGQILFETRSGMDAGEPYNALTLPTFCIEPTQFVQSNWRSYTISTPSSAPSPMMDAQRAVALNFATAHFYAQQSAGIVDSAAAAGFQIALWEIIRDFDGEAGRSSLDLNGGTFKATHTSGVNLSGSVSNWASTFLDVATSSSYFDGSPAYVLHSATSQDQIIPSPGAMAVACVGMLAFGCRRRRG